MPERSEFLSDKLFHVGNRVTKHQDQMRSGNLPGAVSGDPAADPASAPSAAPAAEISAEQRAARLHRLEEVRLVRRDLEQRLARAMIETEARRKQAESAIAAADRRLEILRDRQRQLEGLTIPDEEPLPSAVEIGNRFREVDQLKLEFFRDELQTAAAPAAGTQQKTPPPAAPESFGAAMRRGFAFTLPLMVVLLLAAGILCGFFYWLWH